MARSGVNPFNDIEAAILKGAIIDTKNKGFHSRNSDIARNSTILIAFSWSNGNAPVSGGTKDTWMKCTARKKIHIPLSSLTYKTIHTTTLESFGFTMVKRQHQSNDQKWTQLIVEDCGFWSTTLPDILKPDFDKLWTMHPKVRDTGVYMGRTYETPRWVRAYGVDYIYSGIRHTAETIPEMLQSQVDWANANFGNGKTFNGMLINWYANGSDYIAPHSDNEPSIVSGSPIVSISLGATRKFCIERKSSNSSEREHEREHYTINLKDGDVIVMCGKMQRFYTHGIPKTKRTEVGPRINITLRMFTS